MKRMFFNKRHNLVFWSHRMKPKVTSGNYEGVCFVVVRNKTDCIISFLNSQPRRETKRDKQAFGKKHEDKKAGCFFMGGKEEIKTTNKRNLILELIRVLVVLIPSLLEVRLKWEVGLQTEMNSPVLLVNDGKLERWLLRETGTASVGLWARLVVVFEGLRSMRGNCEDQRVGRYLSQLSQPDHFILNRV